MQYQSYRSEMLNKERRALPGLNLYKGENLEIPNPR